MSSISFLKKPTTVAFILIFFHVIPSQFNEIIYSFPLPKLVPFLAFKIATLILISLYIVKVFEVKLSEKFIRTVSYRVFWIIAGFFAVVPIILAGINRLISKPHGYFNLFNGLPSIISSFQQLEGGARVGVAVIFFLTYTLLAVLGAVYYYIILRISNKLAGYFMTNNNQKSN